MPKGLKMKDYIERRAMEIAEYIISTQSTVRQTAKKFGVSKSTVHKDVTERLPKLNPPAANEVKKVLLKISLKDTLGEVKPLLKI